MLAPEIAALLGVLLLIAWLAGTAWGWVAISRDVRNTRTKLEIRQSNLYYYSQEEVNAARDKYVEAFITRREVWKWPVFAVSDLIESRQRDRSELAAYHERREARSRAEITKRYEAALKDYEQMTKEGA